MELTRDGNGLRPWYKASIPLDTPCFVSSEGSDRSAFDQCTAHIEVPFPKGNWKEDFGPLKWKGQIRPVNRTREAQRDSSGSYNPDCFSMSLRYDPKTLRFVHTQEPGNFTFDLTHSQRLEKDTFRILSSPKSIREVTANVATEFGVDGDRVSGWLENSSAQLDTNGCITYCPTGSGVIPFPNSSDSTDEEKHDEHEIQDTLGILSALEIE